MSGKNLDELEQLRHSDTRYHAVLLASAAIVWIASPEGEFVERQPGWAEYTGQTREEYQYSKLISAIHPDDRPHVTADWMGAVGSGSPVYWGRFATGRRSSLHSIGPASRPIHAQGMGVIAEEFSSKDHDIFGHWTSPKVRGLGAARLIWSVTGQSCGSIEP